MEFLRMQNNLAIASNTSQRLLRILFPNPCRVGISQERDFHHSHRSGSDCSTSPGPSYAYNYNNADASDLNGAIYQRKKGTFPLRTASSTSELRRGYRRYRGYRGYRGYRSYATDHSTSYCPHNLHADARTVSRSFMLSLLKAPPSCKRLVHVSTSQHDTSQQNLFPHLGMVNASRSTIPHQQVQKRWYAYINFEKELEKQIELETFENLIKEKDFDAPSNHRHKKMILTLDVNSASTGFSVMDYDTKEVIDCGAIENLVDSTREYGKIIREFVTDIKNQYAVWPPNRRLGHEREGSSNIDREPLQDFEDDDDPSYDIDDDATIAKEIKMLKSSSSPGGRNPKSRRAETRIGTQEAREDSSDKADSVDDATSKEDDEKLAESILGNRVPLKDCRIVSQKVLRKKLEEASDTQSSLKSEDGDLHFEGPRPVLWHVYIESFLQKYRRTGKNEVVHRLVAFNCAAAYEASLVLDTEPLLFSHATAKSFFKFGRASSGKVMRRRIFNYFQPLLPKYYEVILTKKKKQFAHANFDISDAVMIGIYGRAMVRMKGRLNDDELFKSFLFTEYFVGDRYRARVAGLRRSFDLEKGVTLAMMLERDDVQDHLREKFGMHLREIVREEIINELGLPNIDYR